MNEIINSLIFGAFLVLALFVFYCVVKDAVEQGVYNALERREDRLKAIH